MTLSARQITAANVRAEIARRRLRHRDVAEQLGVDPSWLSRRLNGRAPFTVDDLAAMAALLGLSVSDLVSEAA